MNKDRISALMERIPVPILFLLLIGWFVWGLWEFHEGEESPLIHKRNEITALEAEQQQLAVRLKTIETFRAQLDAKKLDLQELARRLAETRSNLSESFDSASFIRVANSEAERTRLEITAINPVGGPVNNEFYVEHRFDVQFKGVFFQVLLFLQRLADMKTLATVESVGLRPSGKQVRDLNLLEGSLVIKGYNYQRSKADEIKR